MGNDVNWPTRKAKEKERKRLRNVRLRQKRSGAKK
jgi:hypothetical protein